MSNPFAEMEVAGRDMIVENARNQMSAAIKNILQSNGLTLAELAGILNQQQSLVLKVMLQNERQG